MTIAVLSDTHGLLRPKVLEVIKKSDAKSTEEILTLKILLTGYWRLKSRRRPFILFGGITIRSGPDTCRKALSLP